MIKLKISKFASITGLTKDTIYYYINIGILYPKKRGTQFSFQDKDVETVDRIKYYQNMGFSLKEIIVIMSLWRWSNQIEEPIKEEYRNILSVKLDEITNEIKKMESVKYNLIQELEKYSQKDISIDSRVKDPSQKLGVPIRGLDKLRCPKCKNNFNIINASMNIDYIFNGILQCHCGYEMNIVDGVVLTGNTYDDDFDWPDLKRDIYLGMSSDFYKYLNIIGEKILSHLKDVHNSEITIMETNLNGFSFLYNNMKLLNVNPFAILIDKFPEVLMSYKDTLSSIIDKPKVLFIADDSLEYCLEEDSVDYVISLFSANEHQLYKSESYLEHISRYIKPQGKIIGALMTYKKNSKSIKNIRDKYPDTSEDAYDKVKFLYDMNKYFKDIKFEELGEFETIKSNMSFSCHEKGEKMENIFYIGTKK